MVADNFFGRVAHVKGMNGRIKRRSRPITPSWFAPKRIKHYDLLDSAVFLRPILPRCEEAARQNAGHSTRKTLPE
jgi:hypothetical protein